MSSKINIIVAFSNKNFGIGYQGKIPWNIPEDLANFKKITNNSVIIMGRKTWESIPINNRPLKGRFNVVISSDPELYNNEYNNTVFLKFDEIDDFCCQQSCTNYQNIFIIGGESLYKKFIGIADNIYTTQINKNYECDTFFPIENFNKYEIDSYSEIYYSNLEKCNYRFIKYIKTNKEHGELIYLNHMKNILDNGDIKDDRTGTGTRSIFGGQFRFDISNSVPILTSKFVPFQLTIKELLFFLRGETDTKLLEKIGVNIWKGNTSREFLNSHGLSHYEEGDMGGMYGFVLNAIGAEYKGCKEDYTGKGINQLEKLIKGLKEDPWSRRHLITTFCPKLVETGVLYPCHTIIAQFNVSEKNGKKYLSGHFYNRSADWFLGFPINILSHAILIYIIAKMCDYLPYELIISTGDSHLYLNHLKQSEEQLKRSLLPFPKLVLDDSIKNKGFKDIQLSDFNLVGYLSNSKISATMAI